MQNAPRVGGAFRLGVLFRLRGWLALWFCPSGFRAKAESAIAATRQQNLVLGDAINKAEGNEVGIAFALTGGHQHDVIAFNPIDPAKKPAFGRDHVHAV